MWLTPHPIPHLSGTDPHPIPVLTDPHTHTPPDPYPTPNPKPHRQPNPLPSHSQIALYKQYLFNSQSWVCRYQEKGVLRSEDIHGEMWITGMVRS